MNYSLAVKRTIGDYIQRISIMENDASRTSQFISNCNTQIGYINGLNPGGRVVGDIEYENMSAIESSGTGNTRAKCDVIFTVLSFTEGNYPRKTTINKKDIPSAALGTNMANEFAYQTGQTLKSDTNYIIDVTILNHS